MPDAGAGPAVSAYGIVQAMLLIIIMIMIITITLILKIM